MASLKALGVSISEVLSIAGFGNHPLAAHITPSLTHIDTATRDTDNHCGLKGIEAATLEVFFWLQ
jgi:DNA-binding LacI/PurR family transcriptional regulator